MDGDDELLLDIDRKVAAYKGVFFVFAPRDSGEQSIFVA